MEEPETKRLKMMAAAGFIPHGMMYPAVMPGMVPPPGIHVMPGMMPPHMGGPPPMPHHMRYAKIYIYISNFDYYCGCVCCCCCSYYVALYFWELNFH